MSGKSLYKPSPDRIPKLSYCFSCKKDTETILKKGQGIFGLPILREMERYCKICGKQKDESEVEYE